MTRSAILADLAARLEVLRLDHPARVAIDGVDAAGKTVLADEIAEVLRERGRSVIRASVDGFHNPSAVRRRRGSMSPEGYYRDSFDYPALTRALLRPLGPGGERIYHEAVFDFRADRPVNGEPLKAAADAILLVDGVFLLRSELRDFWDYSIFVRADFAVTLVRAERRDLELFGDCAAVRQRYERRYIPGQELYLREARPEEHASIVIDNNDPATPFVVPPCR